MDRGILLGALRKYNLQIIHCGASGFEFIFGKLVSNGVTIRICIAYFRQNRKENYTKICIAVWTVISHLEAPFFSWVIGNYRK